MMRPVLQTSERIRRGLRWARWRGAALFFTFGCGFGGFMMGAGVSDRAYVATADTLTKFYYALGLFVLGGLDLGVPRGGPPLARALLWIAYFAAPAITASALAEGLMRAVDPEGWQLKRMRKHVVVIGCGRLALLYLDRLRAAAPHQQVMVLVKDGDGPNVEEAREVLGARILIGDCTSDAVLRALRLSHAQRVLLLTDNDFTNLDTAARILSIEPDLAQRVVVHVADLSLLRLIANTRIARDCATFNAHKVAASHVVHSHLLEHFERTAPRDTVVLAGFGRFGQTVLDELQTVAAGQLGTVVIVDRHARRQVLQFGEQVGFAQGYDRHVFDGDLRDPALWQQLEREFQLAEAAPVVVLGSGDDGINLRAAIQMRHSHPEALVVARSFNASTFAADVAKEAEFHVFSVAELVKGSFPKDWLDPS